MRVVLVTGTRDLRDSAPVHAELGKLSPDLVLHGWCPNGVDAYTDEWARARGLLVVRVAADWQRHGKRAAGPKRNSVLVRLAVAYRDLGHDVVCLAMPGPKSVGTHDCGRKAHAAGLRIVRVDVPVTRLLRVTGRGFVAGALFEGEPGKGDRAVVVECAPILRWMKRLTWRQVRAELVRKRCLWQWL